MAYALKPIDDAFFTQAPLVIPATVELDAPPERVWEALASERMWSWMPAISGLEWITPEPLGVGATRRLNLLGVRIEEEFYRWDAPHRATFRVTAQTRKLLDGLAEDFLLEPSGAGTKLTWTMAMAPKLPGAGALAPLLAPGMKLGNQQGIAGIKTIL